MGNHGLTVAACCARQHPALAPLHAWPAPHPPGRPALPRCAAPAPSCPCPPAAPAFPPTHQHDTLPCPGALLSSHTCAGRPACGRRHGHQRRRPSREPLLRGVHATPGVCVCVRARVPGACPAPRPLLAHQQPCPPVAPRVQTAPRSSALGLLRFLFLPPPGVAGALAAAGSRPGLLLHTSGSRWPSTPALQQTEAKAAGQRLWPCSPPCTLQGTAAAAHATSSLVQQAATRAARPDHLPTHTYTHAAAAGRAQRIRDPTRAQRTCLHTCRAPPHTHVHAHARGRLPQVAMHLSRETPISLLRPSLAPWRGGVLSLDGVIERLRELLPPRFEDLKREFAVSPRHPARAFIGISSRSSSSSFLLLVVVVLRSRDDG